MTVLAACIIAVLAAVGLVWQHRRDHAKPDPRSRRITEASTRHDVGPDALRLLEDLDAHLDEYLLANPEVAAGFDQLRDAINEHRKEDGS
jgi:hypothetical protein